MRTTASVLHLDLDAFFASVEQRDKPSLRGKPVVVGGIGARGVVATASYEARVFGVRSAMPAHEARRRCPHAAFLAGRFAAYRQASDQVMGLLRELSPLVEPLSLDEAYVDLLATDKPADLSPAGLTALVGRLRAHVGEVTGGLSASVGVASSKFLAKIASEQAKPDGQYVVPPGQEADIIEPLPISVIPGVGPVGQERLHRIGVRTIGDLRRIPLGELSQAVGRAQAQSLAELAYARDDRAVTPDRETKSISVEDTFETDLTDPATLAGIVARHAVQVARRLSAARLFARTVTLKVRHHDFTTHTRSKTLPGATDQPETITTLAQAMLASLDVTGGVRLIGVGVAGLTEVVQDELFGSDPDADVVDDAGPLAPAADQPTAPAAPRWLPGFDVEHTAYGQGWIWGAGLGRVTVRFETRDTAPGPVRTFSADDPELRLL